MSGKDLRCVSRFLIFAVSGTLRIMLNIIADCYHNCRNGSNFRRDSENKKVFVIFAFFVVDIKRPSDHFQIFNLLELPKK